MDKKEIEIKENNEIESKIFSVDIRKFILLTPEIKREDIFQMSEKLGLKIENPTKKDTGLFTLNALNVPANKVDEVIDRANQVKDEIKKQEIYFYDNNKNKLSVDSKMLNLISTFLTEAKKSTNINSSKLKMVLDNILGDLYYAEEENVKFISPETIEHLAKATVSNALEETKTHLNDALVGTLIEIRKLAIIWFFESISLNLYNLRTDRSETYKLQDNKNVQIEGKNYEVVPVNIENKKYRLAFSESENSLITFDLGIKKQNLIIPIITAFFIDKATLKWRLNYSRIIIKAISRLKEQTKHQIQNLKLDYDEINLEELIQIKQNLAESFEFLYQLLFNHKNKIESENESLRRYYQRTYTKKMAMILGGAISEAVRKISPLALIDESDQLVSELESTITSISNLKHETVSIVKELINAKKEENPSLFNKISRKFQEVGENVLAKTFAELLEKLSK